MTSTLEWLQALSPWPQEFGLGRMRALLSRLGHPEREYPAIHVVGSNGKSTATRTVAELLRAEGLRVGAYTSPHVAGWHERLDTDPDTFLRAVERVRPVAEDATQFEILTAAALAQFAEAGVDVAVVEAGLGGRLDATNVLDATVVLLTNVALEHTDVLGETRLDIAREKLAVASPGATVVLDEFEWAPLVPLCSIVLGGAREAATAFLGHPVEREVDVRLPGRLEVRGKEIWDGAHNPAGVDWLVERLPPRDHVLCVSILRDKDVPAMLSGLSKAGRRLVATQSSSPRALAADDLGRAAESFFENVEMEPDPVRALERARALGEAVLVTGSLYLLNDLVVRQEDVRWGTLASG